jgi:sialate O-acetylesterase
MNRRIAYSLPLLLTVLPCEAAIQMAPLFQNGAVIQRDRAVPVWGRATPDAKVTVSFAGQSEQTTADANGRWQVQLKALPASAEGRTMTVTESGASPVEIKDILVGEVWLCSGQSNMFFRVFETTPEDQKLAASPTTAKVRTMHVPLTVSAVRQDTFNSTWLDDTKENIPNFSAVSYFFGRKVSEELKVPVGLIHSSWGGSRIEPWWAEEGLQTIPEYADMVKRRSAASPGTPEYRSAYQTYIEATRQWTATADMALNAGEVVPDAPQAPAKLSVGPGGETGTYQAMIHPLVPYGLRGFLWYQGESNYSEGMAYATKMQALINGWRKQFQVPNGSFLFVEIAPFNYGGASNLLPQLWVAQQEVLKRVPNTGMAGTLDIGDANDIHPRQKAAIGARLARWALADTYGKKDVVRSGPLYRGLYKIEGNAIRVGFNETGSGLTTSDGKAPTWFEVAGDDGQFSPAEAVISSEGKSVVLRSAKVPNPTQARFAWSHVATPNLINKEGIPASAFNTHWPSDPTLGKIISTGKPIESSHPNPSGWNGGLTDGTWGKDAGTCYATSNDPQFPKTVTIDLGSEQAIGAVRYGVPPIGAQKTIAISLSSDGKDFTEIGSKSFEPKSDLKAVIRVPSKSARYVRATFVDHHEAQDQFGTAYGFLSEVEVYAPAAP